MAAIPFARYPGWWFGVSSRSTSHSTMYRRPFPVFFVDTIVPIFRSATKRGFLTHTLSPGLSFSICSPPKIGYGLRLQEYSIRVNRYITFYTPDQRSQDLPSSHQKGAEYVLES